ncbi:MAG: HNH endonuclease [Brevinema sp.]
MKNIFLIIISSLLFMGHAGRLDSVGGHRDSKTGTYHYHISSKEMEQVYKDTLKDLKKLSASPQKYQRSDWNHWIDEDGNGLNTRHEILKRQSLRAVRIKDNKVVDGLWFSVYTGEFFYDPKLLDIDHVVPLKNAHDTGGSNWEPQKKQDYANDLREGHLLAVSGVANREKGAKSPLEWLPPNTSYSCSYIRTWVKIKKRWGLEQEDLTEVSNKVCRRSKINLEKTKQ